MEERRLFQGEAQLRFDELGGVDRKDGKMGFWHTGYIEFHESTGLDTLYAHKPVPPVFTCSQCLATFDSVEELSKHRFETHPAKRPTLLLRGQEVGGARFRVTAAVDPSDVQVHHATTAHVNGSPVAIRRIGRFLASHSHGTVVLQLANSDAAANFELSVEIADPADVRGVDRSLIAMAGFRRLDHQAIEDFIARTRPFTSVAGYVDGICEYLFGVMAKEQSSESHLPLSAYKEKFNRAAYLLRDYQSPVADLVRAIVAFHFNQFETAARLAGTSRLGGVAEKFARWVGTPSRRGAVSVARHRTDWDAFLTDAETEDLDQVGGHVDRGSSLRAEPARTTPARHADGGRQGQDLAVGGRCVPRAAGLAGSETLCANPAVYARLRDVGDEYPR